MAYLDPTTLTCQTCGLSGDIVVVVGVGPNSRKGDQPYRRYNNAGPFVPVEHNDFITEKQLACPKDGTIVWTDIPRKIR